MFVVYRACSTGNPNKKRPIEGKIPLVRACFESFREAFKDVDCTVIALLDKPTNELREIFRDVSVEESYYSNFNEGNINSFHRQISLALQHKEDFLFVEDDYMWLPGSGKKIAECGLPFYTPYDHPGYYSEDAHKYKRDVVLAGGHHWQTVISTTLTFGGKISSLEKEAETMWRYGWADHPMWCDITQRIPLYSPIPTLATHMETDYLAPYWLQTSIL